MRILVVNYEYPPVGGGGGVAAARLAREWARTHEVDYVTTRFGDQPAREEIDGVVVHRVRVIGRRRLDVASIVSMLCYPVSGYACARKLLRALRYDVINTHFAVPSGPLGAALARKSGVPNVLSVHGGDVYDPSKRLSPHRFAPLGWAVRRVMRRASLIVAQSTDIAERATEYFGRDLQEKVRIIPLPFEPPTEAASVGADHATLRSELGLAPRGRYLIGVGRLVPRKGFDRLIASLASLPDDVRLLLIGDGPQGDALRRAAREQGVEDRVHWLGRVSERDRYRYLAAADAFVLSSHHEGFGIVLQEAMSVGLPIVATREGGQRDLLRDGLNAVLIDGNAPDVIAAGVERLLKDGPLRRAMGEANRESLDAYEPAIIAARYIAVFEEAIALHGTGTKQEERK